MSALNKVVRLLWYSPQYKDKELANELTEEFAEWKKEVAELREKNTKLRAKLAEYEKKQLDTPAQG